MSSCLLFVFGILTPFTALPLLIVWRQPAGRAFGLYENLRYESRSSVLRDEAETGV